VTEKARPAEVPVSSALERIVERLLGDAGQN
jgi:hypothetical protein